MVLLQPDLQWVPAPVVTVVALVVEIVVQMAALLKMTLLNHYLQGLALAFCLWHWFAG